MATCWKCSARTRSASPFCGVCGAEVAARINVGSQTADSERNRRPWTALAALSLVVAGFLVFSGVSEQGLDHDSFDFRRPATASSR